MAETVRVTGLTEIRAAFKQVAEGTKSNFPKELRKVADPVKRDTASRIEPYSSSSAAGVRTRVRGASVSVEQSLRKTTGDHPNFGALQMRKAFLPALAANQDQIIRGVEEMIDDVISRAGL